MLTVGLGTSDEHGWGTWYNSKMSANNFRSIEYFDIVQGDLALDQEVKDVVIESYLPAGPRYGGEPRASPWQRSQTALWNFDEVLLPWLISIAERADPETIIFTTSYPEPELEEGELPDADSRVNIRAKEFLNPNAEESNWLMSAYFRKTAYLSNGSADVFTVYDSDGVTVLARYTFAVKQTTKLRYPEIDTVPIGQLNVAGYVGATTGTFAFHHLETNQTLDNLEEFFTRYEASRGELAQDDDILASSLIKFNNGVFEKVGSDNSAMTSKADAKGLYVTLSQAGTLNLDIRRAGEYYLTMMVHSTVPLTLSDVATIPGSLTPRVDFHHNETLEMYAMYVTYHFKVN